MCVVIFDNIIRQLISACFPFIFFCLDEMIKYVILSSEKSCVDIKNEVFVSVGAFQDLVVVMSQFVCHCHDVVLERDKLDGANLSLEIQDSNPSRGIDEFDQKLKHNWTIIR